MLPKSAKTSMKHAILGLERENAAGIHLDLHVGEVQTAPDAVLARAVLERLVATQEYIYAETERNPQVFRKCKNGRLFHVRFP